MRKKEISIVKMDGKKAQFDATKLRRSLKRSGAKDQIISQIISRVETSLYEGISTKEIYKMAFSFLRKTSRPTAARYKLKKAIMELGPTGFPFEKFVGELLSHQGFKTNVGVIVEGECVNHEVDVIAEKNDSHFIIECKFHSEQARHCDVKIPLYIHSRFLDLKKQWLKSNGHRSKFFQGWIFTNTRFTDDALRYGNCAGLNLVSWDYPEKGSLKERVDEFGLYPITTLTSLTKRDKQLLLSKNKVLCIDLCHHPELLDSIGISEARKKNILKEVHDLCKYT